MQGGVLVRSARQRAGLTQTELADRAGTTQSAIARLETGRAAASFDRVHALVRLCGLDLDVGLVEVDAAELELARRNLELTPDARVRNMLQVQRLVSSGRRSVANRRSGSRPPDRASPAAIS